MLQPAQSSRSPHARAVSLLLILCLACGGSADLGGPGTPGSIHVTTATSGASPDPDGYRLQLDNGSAAPVGLDADTTLSGLTPGAHTLSLTDVAGNCTVDGQGQRTAQVQSGSTAEVEFTIDCSGPPSSANACVLPQVTNAAEWSAAIAGNIGRFGDTIWVKGGSYPGESVIQADDKVFRACPGERVTLGNVVVFGDGVTLWGFEVAGPPSSGKIGIDTYGIGSKLINNVVHDAGHSGIGLWWNTQGGMAYGNIVYNNGTADNLDHGIYFNNRTGTMRLTDNVVFDNWAYGMHGFSSTAGELSGLVLDGNVTFGGHGIGAFNSSDVIVGGVSVPVLTVTNHRSYKPDGYASVILGRADGPTNGSVTVNGTFVGTPGLLLSKWTSINQSEAVNYAFSAKPTTGNQVFVRPNLYEPGRGHVVVYNWANDPSVAVDLSPVLTAGRTYEIRSVCDLWGEPKVSGTYDGGMVSIPMTSHPAPAPVGRTPDRPPPACGGTFGVFLVVGR
jgi:hypothetical protein